MDCIQCGSYTEISYGDDLVLCSECACEAEEAERWEALPTSERMRSDIAMASCYADEVAQLEAENERLRRYLTTREIEERMELDDLVNRLKGENNRLREYAEFVQERDLEAVFQDWLALLEGKDE